MLFSLALWLLSGCGSTEAPPPPEPAPAAPAPPPPPPEPTVDPKHQALFKALPADYATAERPVTPALVQLGQALYHDARLSKSQTISCNSCHQVEKFGVDNEPTSPGHDGTRGGRNSPTSFNAAGHLAQFWDGRAPDVEAQAAGPILNPIEMGMPDEKSVEKVVRSIPGYADLFKAAFPGDDKPITYANLTTAIGAFERKLSTPGRFDAYLGGDAKALSAEERAGLDAFVQAGCISCHMGALLGGTSYQKLGAVEPYPTEDLGRYEVTKNEADKYFFKVPSLRNVTKTAPYFHDGKVATLEEAIKLMGKHQLGKDLDEATIKSIATFLGALEGKADPALLAKPTLPENGPKTPGPS